MDEFFEHQHERSRVKSEIVARYFWLWAQIILGQLRKDRSSARVRYFDLFSGPGSYLDGKPSTPLLVLTTITTDTKLHGSVEVVFNDKDKEAATNLARLVSEHDSFKELMPPIRVYSEEVGQDLLNRVLTHSIPTLSFVDPFGYKGMSQGLIGKLLQGFGSECIVFFNYRQFNRDITNPITQDWIDELLSKQRADALRSKVLMMGPQEREDAALQSLTEAFADVGGDFVLPFMIRDAKSNRTSQYILHVSKKKYGHDKMKDVMARSAQFAGRVGGKFVFDPKLRNQESLFVEADTSDLEYQLLVDFWGATLFMSDIIDIHGIGKSFREPDYRRALLNMETRDEIICNPPESERRPGTLPITTLVRFKGGNKDV